MSEPPRAPWERMAEYVFQLLRAVPWAQEHEVRMGAHSEALWLHVGRDPTTPYCVEAQGPEWWDPPKRSHGQALLARLLDELREKWEARPQRGPDGWLLVPELGIELGPGTRVSGAMVHAPGRILAHEGHHQVVSVEEALERGWARRERDLQ